MGGAVVEQGSQEWECLGGGVGAVCGMEADHLSEDISVRFTGWMWSRRGKSELVLPSSTQNYCAVVRHQ